MTERRYDEEEVAAIFEIATKAQAGAGRQMPSGDGLTLSGLQEIGREVGIAPELVAQAAISLDRGGRESTRRLLGLPIGVGRTVDLGRKVSDAEWEQFVVHLREAFDATGRTRAEGGLRQWSNGNLQVNLEPTPTGHQLSMRTVRSTSLGYIGGGAMLLLFGAALFVSLYFAHRLGEPKKITALLFMATTGLALLGWGALPLPRWANTRRRQMVDLIRRLSSTTQVTEDSAPGDR